jgi:sec-independent protein translocase protein TatB
VDILGVGPMELIVILLLLLMFFGPDRLPEIGAKLGKGVRSMRRATRDFSEEIQAARDAIEKPASEIASPVKQIVEPIQEVVQPFQDVKASALALSQAAQAVRDPGKAIRDSVMQSVSGNKAAAGDDGPHPAEGLEDGMTAPDPAALSAPENPQPAPLPGGADQGGKPAESPASELSDLAG